MLLEFVVLAVLIVLSGIFSGVEVSLLSVSHLKVRNLVKQRRRGALALHRLKENPERWLIAILIGNNVVNVAASALATYTATLYFGYIGVGLAAGVITLLILVFGEIVPKTLATVHGEHIALFVAGPLEVLLKLIYPLIVGFEAISSFIGSLVKRVRGPLITEEELMTMVEVGVEEKVIDKEEKELIERVLDFSDIRVKAIMTPKSRMLCLKGDLTVHDAVRRVNKTRFSRFPVYVGEDHDRDLGVVHIKDMLKVIDRGGDIKLRAIAKKPLFTSRESSIGELFREMKRRRQHMAIVVNEFGVTEGLVTLENLIEEIVGEIRDEAEIPPHGVAQVDARTFIAHGDTEIARIEEALKIRLPHFGGYVTLGGFLHHMLRRIPERGSSARIDNIIYTVEEVADNKPTKVRITVLDEVAK